MYWRDQGNNSPSGFALASSSSGDSSNRTSRSIRRACKVARLFFSRLTESLPSQISRPRIANVSDTRSPWSRPTSMAYAAPEQWHGTAAAELDGRTDLYALGGLLYEMLTGQTPFHAENYEGWAHQHQTTPPQPPSTLRPDLANWQGLDALVLRLLAKDRNDRPTDVAEPLNLIDAVRYLHPDVRQDTVAEL